MRDDWKDSRQKPTGEYYTVRHVRCNSPYCRTCGTARCIKLQRLIERGVERFRNARMLTLTVYREGFADGPAQAYDCIMKKKLVSLLKRELKNKFKALNHNHHVWVMEFHEPGKDGIYWPHFHVLIDSAWGSLSEDELWQIADQFKISRDQIHSELAENVNRKYKKTLDDIVLMLACQGIWNRYATTFGKSWKRTPEYYTKRDCNGKLIYEYYQMGRVDVTAFRHDKAGKDLDQAGAARAAAYYMSKYLGWFPEAKEGQSSQFPEWVRDSSHIPRSHTSQGFRDYFGLTQEQIEDDFLQMTDDEIEERMSFDPEDFETSNLPNATPAEIEAAWEEFPEYIGVEDETGEIQPIQTGWIIRHNAITGEQIRIDPTAESQEVEPVTRRTIGQRIALCRQQTVVLHVESYEKQTGETFVKYRYIETLRVPFDELSEELKNSFLTREQVDELSARIRRANWQPPQTRETVTESKEVAAEPQQKWNWH